MKKVCIISENHWLEYMGGAELQCHYIGEELLKHNFKVYHLFYTQQKNLISKNGIILKPIYIPKLFKKIIGRFLPVKLLVEYALLYKHLKVIDADFWYYRSANTFLVPLVKLKKKFNTKLIFALSTDSQTKRRSLISRHGNYYFQKYKKSIAGIDHIIFQKYSQRDQFEKEFSRSGEVIYFGHPPIKSNHLKPKILFHPLKVLWVGNLKKIKQPELFFEIVKKLFPYNIEFHMAGQATNSYLEMITDLQVKNKNFFYHGQLDNENTQKIMHKSHILVSTSKTEGFPNVFIEAWKHGLPVISLVDIDDIFEKYNIGYYCKNINQIVEKIIGLYKNKHTYYNYSENSSTFFFNNLTSSHTIKNLLNIFNEGQL